MKKILFAALIALIVIQLFVPISRVINKNIVLKTGTEFKFRVNPIDPYDPFRGRYVSLNARQALPDVISDGRYGIIEVDKDGFAKIVSVSTEKPASGHYVKSGNRNKFKLPIDRFYMDERFAPRAERLAWERKPGKETYVTVRIKKGNLVITNLHINDDAIEDLIQIERRWTEK